VTARSIADLSLSKPKANHTLNNHNVAAAITEFSLPVRPLMA
jgi:hypothetical protein